MATATVPVVPDLTKVVFNPSKSVTFVPVAKKQMVQVEVTNNSTSDVAVKFKNTGPTIYKTTPPQAKIGIGEKKVFSCIFKGLPKEKCKSNDRFTVVFIAASKNVVIEKAWKNAHKTATLKHKIAILFQGINDQRENETQQPTNNEEDEDKDRQGQMRSKMKNDVAKGKKATVVMFMRKDGESLSDEDDEEGTGGAQVEAPPGDDMMTTRNAGAFTGQVASNAADGGPKSEFRTTRPAGFYNGQVASNEAFGAAGAAAGPNSEFKTTRQAGAYTGQVASNAVPGEPVDLKSAGFKTTRQAGAFTGQVAVNAVPGGSVDPKSGGLRTTRQGGAFTGQVTPNAAGSSEVPDLRSTKPAGTYDNPQQQNK